MLQFFRNLFNLPLSEEEYQEFINTGQVAERHLWQIAFKVKDRDGKFVDDDRALDEVRRLVDKGRRSGRSVEDINSSLLNFKPVFNAERSKSPSAAGDDIFRSAWASIQPPKEQPAQAAA